jgi:hypothetical protein
MAGRLRDLAPHRVRRLLLIQAQHGNPDARSALLRDGGFRPIFWKIVRVPF